MFATLNYEVTEEMLRQMIAAVDTDQSGNLSFREFIALVILVSNSLNTDEPEEKSTVEFTSEDHARFTELFRSVDTDGSGSISTSELGNLFDNLGYETSEELMQQFIAMVDTDNDGVLNYNEFVQLIIYYLESLKQAS